MKTPTIATYIDEFFRSFREPSVSRNLTVSLALIISIVVVGMACVRYLGKRAEMRAELSTRTEESIEELSEILAIPVWTFDQKSIERVGSVFMQDEDVHEVLVTDSRGRVLFQFNREADSTRKVTSTRPIIYNNQKIGEAKIVLSLGKIHQELSRLLQVTVWYLLGSVVVILVVTGLLLRIFLRKPLQAMQQGMDRIAQGDYSYSFEELRERELYTIAKKFKGMSYQVEAREISLREINKQLREEIEERENAEQAFRESQARFREVVEGTDDLVTQVDGQGRFTYVNHKAEAIYGRKPEELVGLSAFDFIHPADQERTREHFVQWIQDKVKGATFENRQVNQVTGDIHEILWTINPHYDGQGDLVAVNSIATDITSKKKAEEEHILLEEQLRQSQKMEALGNLAGGIAHDFNNLLQVMSGYIQLMLMRTAEESDNRKYLKEVGRAADRASELVRRLLTFSRKMEVKLSPVNLNKVITNSVELLQRTIPKMVQIQTNLAQDLQIIQADPVQMEQVLMNLATNAVDAMHEVGTLTISTENFDVDSDFRNRYLELLSGEYVMVKVTDTGHGFDETIRKRIFEPFFTTKSLDKGTGLGLSIVYGIVKGHKGYIECDSEVGVGTTFTIFLPVEHVVEEFTGEAEQPSEEFRGGSETILLVDDETLVLEIAEELLTTLGYTVRKVQSGEAALAVLQQPDNDINLVVMDLGMPGMGGEKCLQEILKLDGQARVIVASGYAAHKIAKDPEKFGAAGFISKPYRLHELANKVRTVLDRP